MSSKSFPEPVVWLLALALLPPTAGAASFGAGISPSKFELRAEPGEVLRDTVTIMNAGDEAADYQFRTVDWQLNDTSNVEFIEGDLVPGSCRPWVRLERKVVRIRPGGQKKYRFEVHVPADAAPGLCRFAILIEPGQEVMARLGGDGDIAFPVVGRYAVITYVTIGAARADIDYLGIGERRIGEQRVPALKLYNAGQTYDRAFGEVTATDPSGRRTLLVASTFPVLPGRREEIALAPENPPDGSPVAPLVYPLELKGKVEIAGRTIRIDTRVE